VGDKALSLQISKIVLYSRTGAMRELPFNLGGLTVLTGASKTGKSAIIDIVDYCTGRSECNVADGVIRKHVGWYAVLFQLGDGQIFIARRNPEMGEKTSSDIYMDRSSEITVPAMAEIFKNTTVSAVEKFLAAAIGISENENRPPAQTRDPLEANFRHSLLLSIQDQNDIDSKTRLFHRQDESFIGQAIKDTLPYFLGAIDEDRLFKQSLLDQAKRKLRQLERQLKDSESQDTETFSRAKGLFEEAKEVGLIDERKAAINYTSLMDSLKRIAEDNSIRNDLIVADGEDILASLRNTRQALRRELEKVNEEIRSTKMFTSESSGYESEVKEQRARLSSVGLVRDAKCDEKTCPLCDSSLSVPIPTISKISESLKTLNEQLDAVEAENPRLQLRLASLQRDREKIEDALRENQMQINHRMRENEIHRVQQDNFILQARTTGKIQQYIEVARDVDDDSALKSAIAAAQQRLTILEAELDMDDVREKLNTFLNIIGGYMTHYSTELDLEHKGSQLRLDIRNLTVVADTLDGPVPLYRMGSGENWVGYHVLAHLGVHKWFRQKNRPVPGFIILDQPSQAHYPPEKDAEGSIFVLKNEDQAAVFKLFKLIADVAKELQPNLQIIVMDHADLQNDWFQDAVVERWRNGKKLIPQEWIIGE
jgi:hypothetical protein